MTFINLKKPNVNYRTVTTPQGPVSATVGTTSSEIVAQNNSRSGLIIVNLSTSNVYLAFTSAAIVQGGVTLLPTWGWKMSEYDFCVDSVNAIADQPGSIVSVQEFNI